MSSASALPGLPYVIQTGSGKLTITASTVTFDVPRLRGMQTERLARSTIVSVGSRVVIKATFGRLGGLDDVTISTNDGRELVIKRVPHKYTQTVIDLLMPQ